MESFSSKLRRGLVIPAHPLALTAKRKLDEIHQRKLTRYYREAGAGGVAVGVHTTQFAIREHGLLEPVLALAAEECAGSGMVLVAGAVGKTPQAASEAALARDHGYDCVLVSLSAFRHSTLDEMIDHLRAVGEVLPIFGFYLQPAVGGRALPFDFWVKACEVEALAAIKMAPFNRYQTLDVVRAMAASGRAAEIALYTGNDDNIVADLLTPFRFGEITVRVAGGLLGQWAVGAASAVRLLNRVKSASAEDYPALLSLGVELTDLNAALFDAANHFHGCIAGINEILRRQGLLAGRWCLDDGEDLSPGQMEEIDRVVRLYPHLIE